MLSVVLLFSLIPSVFALPENLFNGSSLFEKLPLIEAGNTADFRIKLFYKSGPYVLEDLSPIIDIYPQSLTRYLAIKTESVSGSLYPVTTVIIKGNITASPDIPAGKTSLLYYFSAKDMRGNSYRSSWSDSSPPIDIQNEQTLAIKHELFEKARQTIEPAQIVIKYDDPPRKQFRAGITSEEIKCKEGLGLVIKVSSGFPACVKPQSIQKLFELGWAVNDQMISEEEAISLIKKRYPQLQDFPSDGLPPKLIRSEKSSYGWYVMFETQGSGIPIIEAKCFLVDNAKIVYQIGKYKNTGDMKNYLSVKTCS
ncbi:MAG: hypothetical protein ACT4NJ_06680 [Nitrosopumilaceae archaeon]